MKVVAHQPKHHDVWLWVQADTDETGWRVSISDGSARRSIGSELGEPQLMANLLAGQLDTRVWWYHVRDLRAGTRYEVGVGPGEAGDADLSPVASFSTLPEHLERPFTVLLGSCYSEDRDTAVVGATALTDPTVNRVGRVAQQLAQLVRRAVVTLRRPSATRSGSSDRGPLARRFEEVVASGTKPDLKLLVGDQVYLDSPIWRLLFLRRPAAVERQVSRTYSRSWAKLDPLLACGGNYFMSDDHEFWNNYPHVPLYWPSLWSHTTRRTWELYARHFLGLVQRSRPTDTFTVGSGAAGVSFFLADTRRNRTVADADGGPRFMAESDLDELVTWLAGLEGPGVLVLGQPVFADPGEDSVDANLPNYTAQYRRLCRALVATDHDVLVLTGDIHYGRLVEVEWETGTGAPKKVVELVSSPMAVLAGAASRYPEHPETATVGFLEAVSGVRGAPESTFTNPIPYRSTDRYCPDHFMMLSFVGREGAVDVTVTSHLVRTADTPPPRTITLR